MSEKALSNEEIAQRLAVRVKGARQKLDLSLEALSKLSGVSRSMLSQIERAESCPTVATLWNLATALKLDMATLLDANPVERSPIREFLTADQTPVILSKGKGVRIRVLSAPEMAGETEIYDLEFEAKAALDSGPHRAGCIENLTVFKGELMVTSDGVSQLVKHGETVRYVADKDHSISAQKKAARAVLVVSGS
jgi:transcriptional regulator with XRE-family HTH domain